MSSNTEVVAWVICSIALLGVMTYLIVTVNVWFWLLIFALPSYKNCDCEDEDV